LKIQVMTEEQAIARIITWTRSTWLRFGLTQIIR
jgi:hypothetical protein